MPIKMLVVDDEPDLESLIRQKFRKQIREGEYQFVFAQNGVDALAKMSEHPDTTLILSDINMPEMDGLTLLTKLNELNNPALKSVIVSAYGDMENIRTAMNRGAFDFITKPIDFQDLEVTIDKTIRHIELIRRSLEEHDILTSVQRDLSIAARIQQSILPSIFPPFPHRPEFDIYATMQPAKEVGGDFYDFFLIDDSRLGLVIGDVSGKGIPAAIFMAQSRSVLKAIALQVPRPGDVLTTVNNMLVPESDEAVFVTVFYGILDPSTGSMTYSIGGHNPPFLLRQDGSVGFLEHVGGSIIGKISHLSYDTATVTLKPGETLFLYTDGVPEAANKDKAMYDESRLKSSLEKYRNLPLKDLLQSIQTELKEFANGEPQSDDITMLAVRYKGNDATN